MDRCFGTGDEIYERYHDEEWGRMPEISIDERELLERLALEGFQSGLSWLTILRKRDAFREAFTGFDPIEVAGYDEADVERLMADERIVRNRRKIQATISNARALVDLHDDGGTLLGILRAYAPPARTEPPRMTTQVPSATEETRALSKRLKTLGFTFVGPVTLYATLQAIGLVDDHLADCWLAAPPA